VSDGTLSVRPLVPGRWDDLAALFRESGAYSHCWCTWWRQPGGAFDAGCANGGAGNRDLLRRLTDEGREPGLIAYRDDGPVAWTSVGPRRDFGRILRSPNLRPGPDEDPDDPAVWSVVCFWMPRIERGRGLATALLDAAIVHARERGATALEAYPVDTGGARHAASGLFTGPLAMYLRAGFETVPERSARRPVVRLALTRPGGASTRGRAGART
jgi:GNAT superfamily N-acetyltransferase